MKIPLTFSYRFLIISTLISLITGFLVYIFFPFYDYIGADKALEGMLLLSSISLGFYGACLSVLASIFNTKVVKEIMKDNEEKKEFVIISCFTLLTGFFTAIITIIYQVMLSNGQVALDIINSLWFFVILLFFCMKLLFVLMIFMILFNNKDEDDKETKVYLPNIKSTK